MIGKYLFRNRSIVYVSLIFILSILSLAWMSNLQSENQSKAQVAAESILGRSGIIWSQ